MAVKLGPATPILRIFNVALAEEFYITWLGFTKDFEHRFYEGAPVYMQVSRGSACIHLSEHHGDACPGAALRFEVSNGLDNLLKELKGKPYKGFNPAIEEQSWGCRELSVLDPFHNRIVFFENIDRASAASGEVQQQGS